MWPGLSWDAHLETWIGWYGTRSWDTIRQLRKDLDGGETHILKPVWVWDDAWMELRCNLVDMAGGEMLPGCGRDADWGEIQLRQRRNTNLGAWFEIRHKSRDLGGVEMGPGLSWDENLETRMGWYGTVMELSYNSPVEIWPGWRWDTHLETCMHLRWCLDGAKMQFGWPGCRRDENIKTWIEVRLN